METKNGILMKSIGGFYYVRCDGKIYECKARGSFRKSGSSPIVGDNVTITVPDEGFAAIEAILPRRNKLKRPALANIDVLVIVCSTVDPMPNFTIIDKMTAVAVKNEMTPVVVVSKNDLQNGEEIARIYSNSGIDAFLCSPDKTDEISRLKEFLTNKVSAFTGNSGVGKSTLLNALFPQLKLETGDISQKLGRGRHTTRVVELFDFDNCLVADTPGFSTVDLQRYEMIDKNQLQYCFPEFKEYINKCQFTSCAHICEKGCSVLEALKEGKIAKTRHQSYVAMYNEVKDIKSWQVGSKK